MRGLVLLAALGMPGVLAAGETQFSPPPGCKGFLSVQTKDCHVEHHWTCEGEPEGTQWIMMMDAQGPNFLQQVDGEFGWLKSYNLGEPERRELMQSSRDMNALSTLLASGFDDYDFDLRVLRDNEEVAQENVSGRDRLTGETVVIDGEPLLVVDFIYEEVNSAEADNFKAYGTQYVSEKFGSFFLGTGTEGGTESGAQTSTYDATPMRFIEPGEPGFFSRKPQYGCNQIMSGLMQPLATDKENNDDI